MFNLAKMQARAFARCSLRYAVRPCQPSLANSIPRMYLLHTDGDINCAPGCFTAPVKLCLGPVSQKIRLIALQNKPWSRIRMAMITRFSWHSKIHPLHSGDSPAERFLLLQWLNERWKARARCCNRICRPGSVSRQCPRL